MVQAGHADGELGRTFGYLKIFPNLVRLSEANNIVHFCVYGAGASAVFEDMEKIRLLQMRCECRRGIPELELFLTANLGKGRFSQIGDVGQGLRKLQLGRTDFYFDVQEAVQDHLALNNCNNSSNATPVIRELAKISSTTGHCYLNRKHANHAARMAEALGELKRNGTVDRYLQECLLVFQKRCTASN